MRSFCLAGRRLALILLALQLGGAVAPLLLLPRDTWRAPFVLTMDGQFIVKDVIVIAAWLILVGVGDWRRSSPAGGPD